ncbi:DUF6491 family protein [Phenylobacterium sp.]|jgi:hypothetical protein|uniref:DUF6491 family protein n=1 Tax=Phenylobacterium sp. TaxID=1871053 RepID=UPI002F3F580E
MKTPLAIAASAAVLALGVAGAPFDSHADSKPASKDVCFWARNVTSFAAPDDHTVYVRVNQRDVYRLDLMISCPDVNWNQAIALQSSHGAGGSICNALDAEIISHATGLGRQRCPVKTLTKLTPEEIATLPKGAKP